MCNKEYIYKIDFYTKIFTDELHKDLLIKFENK